MKKSMGWLTAAALVLGTVVSAPAIAGPNEKTHDLKAEIVSYDAKAKTLTIKDETGKQKTVPVLDSATATIATFKAGDKVVLTCADKENGDHLGVSAVRSADAPKH